MKSTTATRIEAWHRCAHCGGRQLATFQPGTPFTHVCSECDKTSKVELFGPTEEAPAWNEYPTCAPPFENLYECSDGLDDIFRAHWNGFAWTGAEDWKPERRPVKRWRYLFSNDRNNCGR